MPFSVDGREKHPMNIAVLGIDLGKMSCGVAGLDGSGAVVLRRRVRRYRLLSFLSQMSPCVVAMEGSSPLPAG